MRLKLGLSLAFMLVVSCQENTSTVQEPVKEVEKVSTSLDEDQQKGLDRLTMALEKALTSDFDNKVKGELISRYISRFELSDSDIKKIINTTMDKFEVPSEDRKEIIKSFLSTQKTELE